MASFQADGFLSPKRNQDSVHIKLFERLQNAQEGSGGMDLSL